MTPYRSKTPDDIERIFEREDGVDFGDLIVPSQVGLPVATGLTGADLERETSKFFDDRPLDAAAAATLIAELTGSH